MVCRHLEFCEILSGDLKGQNSFYGVLKPYWLVFSVDICTDGAKAVVCKTVDAFV